MNIVFCVDRRVLAGLHVAAKSLLTHLSVAVEKPVFWVIAEEIDDADIALLGTTLASTGRSFRLHLKKMDAAPIQAMTQQTGSLAIYYRMFVAEQIDADRFLYLDVDTLCHTDVSTIMGHDLGGHPIALCAEGPISSTADTSVLEALGPAATGIYFNTGVMLVDSNRWRETDITVRCLHHLQHHRADYWDQSVINCVLHGDIATLPPRYNWYTNVRAHWPALKPPLHGQNTLLHFVDYPKPWSRHGRWVHPFGGVWWSAYRKTAHYRAGNRPDLEIEYKAEQWPGYKKAIKDRVLFSAYSLGWFRPKGVPSK